MNKENKLIAEFMGWECRTRKSYEDNIKVLYKPDGSIFKYSGFGYLRNKTPWDAPFQFHNSWDWLMPCCIKISELLDDKYANILTDEGNKLIFDFGNVQIFDKNLSIEEVKDICVEFIKWYNKKQKNDRN